MGRPNTKIRKALFLNAYKALDCNVSKAADQVGISRATYWDWKTKDEEFAQKLIEADEALLDELERIVIDKAKAGDDNWLKEILRVRGCRRNWSKSAEGAVSGNLTINITREVINAPAQG